MSLSRLRTLRACFWDAIYAGSLLSVKLNLKTSLETVISWSVLNILRTLNNGESL